MTEEALFDLPADWAPPTPPEALSRSERRKQLIATRIAHGVHPLGRPLYLHKDGGTCGECRFRVSLTHHGKSYPKCWWPDVDAYPHPRDSHSDASDIRAWWPACSDFQRKGDE